MMHIIVIGSLPGPVVVVDILCVLTLCLAYTPFAHLLLSPFLSYRFLFSGSNVLCPLDRA